MRARRSRSAIDHIAFVLCIGTMLAIGCAPQKHSVTSEIERLQGTWQLVYQQMNGKKLPDEETAKMFHGQMVFAGDKIHYSVELPGFDFAFAYKLRPEVTPKTIDLELIDTVDKQGIGQKTFGIYSLERDTLKICHSKGVRPKDFDAGDGSHNMLIVLKRKLELR